MLLTNAPNNTISIMAESQNVKPQTLPIIKSNKTAN